MMKHGGHTKWIPLAFGWLIILLAIISCGGGGGSSDLAGGGISGTGITAYGEITGFGSVIVNGIKFDVSEASVMLDDEPGDETRLRIGMMVRVSGRDYGYGTGRASRVEYHDNLEGPIDSINFSASSFAAMGQTIFVNSQTYFDDDDVSNLAGLEVGNIVEVCGFLDANGNIRATYVKLKKTGFQSGDEIEIKGTVTNLDTGVNTFSIGNLTVNYGTAQLDDLSGGIQNGIYVEVESNQPPLDDLLIATKVEREDDLCDFDDDDDVEIEGFVTQFTSASQFEVNGYPVRTTAGTEFDDGSSADIALNVKLDVEGWIDSNGVLVATEIDFDDDDEFAPSNPDQEQTGVVGEVTIDDDIEVPQGMTLTLNGTIVNGNVFVRRGAQLIANGSRIIGNVQAYDAFLVDLRGSTYVDGDVQGKRTRSVIVHDGTRVGGNVQIEETPTPESVDALWVNDADVDGDVQAKKSSGRLRVTETQIGGNLQFEENYTGLYEITYNQVDGDLQFFKNRGAGTITDNSVGGNLQSKENSPRPTIENNNVEGSSEIE